MKTIIKTAIVICILVLGWGFGLTYHANKLANKNVVTSPSFRSVTVEEQLEWGNCYIQSVGIDRNIPECSNTSLADYFYYNVVEHLEEFNDAEAIFCLNQTDFKKIVANIAIAMNGNVAARNPFGITNTSAIPIAANHVCHKVYVERTIPLVHE